jgi:hypothetical protein
MTPLASITDLHDRVPGGIDQEGTARAQAILEDASALIRAEAGKTWTDDDPPVAVPPVIKTVCLSAARRAYLNPDGIESIGLDGHTASFTTGSPDVYLTKAETRAVRRAAGKSGLWTLSTTRAEGDIGDVPAVDQGLRTEAIEEIDPFGAGWP